MDETGITTVHKPNRVVAGSKVKKKDDSDSEDCFCLVCMENVSNSRSNEKWVTCAITVYQIKISFLLMLIILEEFYIIIMIRF